MKWLYKILTRKYGTDGPQLTRESSLPGIKSTGVNLTIYRADGRHIIESHQYNRKTDESFNQLFIVRDDADLGEKLAHVVTYELLRR